jgi:hypothetical protein
MDDEGEVDGEDDEDDQIRGNHSVNGTSRNSKEALSISDKTPLVSNNHIKTE